ncbi:MAG: hypothetical protein PVJ02_19865, partial [Gemmatimonadota bacterium]
VGGLARERLAHILADGRVSQWNPGANDYVRVIVVVGPTIYVGGAFSTVGGQPRARAAALDAVTGAVLPWNPNVQGNGTAWPGVHAMVVDGDSVFLGGDFTHVGGFPWPNLAKVSATGAGALDATWNPAGTTPPTVYSLVVSGTRLFVGGSFTSIGGQARNRLASMSTLGSGSVDSWDPSPDGSVFDMELSGGSVYVGGFFSTIGSPAVTRERLALLDTATGAADGTWNPGGNVGVYDLSLAGGLVYCGGAFDTVAGQSRRGLAAVDALTGALDPWNPGANATVTNLIATGPTVLAGGSFTSIGLQERSHLAALDLGTGAITAWNPDADLQVRALAAEGGTIYAGGQFSTIGGTPRPWLAALDASGALVNWTPNPDGWVNALAISGNRLVVGGIFDNIGNPGQNLPHLAVLDRATAANLWGAGAGDTVNAVATDGTSVYVGGYFAGRLAKRALSDGSYDFTWNPNPTGVTYPVVNALLLAPGALYVGGEFSTIGGQARDAFAAVDPANTGAALPWDPQPAGGTASNSIGNAFDIYGAGIVLGGNFYWLNGIGGAARQWLGTVDATTALATPRYTQPDGLPLAVKIYDDRLFVGGAFDVIGGQPRDGFAVFCMLEPPTGLTATASADNTIGLSWTSAAASHSVYRSRSPGVRGELIGTTAATSFDDTSAEGGVAYFYTVTTLGPTCESGPSNEATTTTSGLCSLPPDFEGASWAWQPDAQCRIDLGWAAGTSPCGGAVTYTVYRDTSPAFTPSGLNRIATGIAGTTYSDFAAVSPSTTWYYVVRAASADTGEEEANLIRVAATTTACSTIFPAPVHALTVTSSSGNNRIEWKNPDTGPYAFTRINYTTASDAASCAYPVDETAGTLLIDKGDGGLGGHDYVNFAVANDGTTYCYAAWVSDGAGGYSSSRTAHGRPFDTSGPVKWAYSTGATSMAAPGLSTAVLTVSNDRYLHAVVRGTDVDGGTWPPGWTPLAMNEPAQSRPPVVPGTVIPPSAEVVLLGV